jgi:hypothetical protein
MDGMVSWLVLVVAFVAVAGASSILIVKLFRAGARSGAQIRKAAHSGPAEESPLPEPSLSQSSLS